MDVLILEDSKTDLQRLLTILDNIREACKIENIYGTSHGEEILLKAKTASSSDIFILDIENSSDPFFGLKIARRINELGNRPNIIFFTSHSSMTAKAFEFNTGALDFLDKAGTDETIGSKLKDTIHFIQKNISPSNTREILSFSGRYYHFEVFKDDIYYFETTGAKHKIKLVSKNKSIEFTSTLKEVEQLNHSFLRTHQGYIVNWDNVIGLDKKRRELFLIDEKKCPVSRSYYVSLKKKISEINEPIQ